MDKTLKYLKEAWERIEESNLEVITELKEVGEGDYVLLYKGNIWRFPEEMGDEENSLLNNFITEIGLDEEYLDFDTSDSYWFYEFAQKVLQEENRHDIIAGDLDGSSLTIINTGAFTHDSKSSISIKKLAKHLGVSEVRIADTGDEEYTVYSDEIKGEIPDRAYHGTSSEYLLSILRIGLRPRKHTTAKGNYDKQGIEHFEHIFFTTRKGEAQGHSVTTAHQTHSLPVVIEFVIPDKDKIIPDYDVATMSKDGMNTFAHIGANARVKKIDIKPERLSQEVGIYGYAGAIPPKAITKIYVATEQEVYDITEYQEFDVEEGGKTAIAEAFQIISNYMGDENPFEEYLYDKKDIMRAVEDLNGRLEEIDGIEELDSDEVYEKAEEISYDLESIYDIPFNIIMSHWQEKQ